MAGSRLQNFGTIFSRTTGLLKSGGLKETPLWYDVYRKYPPDMEPNAERPIPPQDPIPEIVYEEDFERVQKAKTSRERKGKFKNINSKIPHLARMSDVATMVISENIEKKVKHKD